MTTEGTLLTMVGSVVVAFITVLFTYLGVKSKSRVDVQSSLNSGFQQLITELQKERKALDEERGVLRAMVKDQDAEILDLRRRVEKLLLVTTSFHNYIVSNGLVPPPFEDTDILRNDES